MNSIDDFLTDLKNKSLSCELDTLRESLVMDMFIVGLSNQAIKEKLLQEEFLNMEKAIKIAKAIEITQLQARNLNKSTEVVVAKVGRSAHNSANWQKSKNSHLSNQVEGHSVEDFRWSCILGVYDGEQAKVRSPPTPAQRIIWSIIPAQDLKVYPQSMLDGGCICWR
ncbi:hypothetical protein JTB14_014364 [Gonioctena quinquepunctata]|nr:hypothetical protein JTB14_014364 [Gonioctena quinquepunctata]